MANMKDTNQPITVTTALDPASGTTIPTSGGTLSVRPYRSSSTSKLKALVTFTPRASGLDRSNVKAASDEFRGFYSLFWIGLALLFVRTSYDSWETNRTILSGTFGRLITTDVLVLALSDAIMVGSMFVCVPFVKGLVNGWYGYYWVGAALQHAWQCVFLGMAIWWGFHRQWYWVQSGFLVLRKSRNSIGYLQPYSVLIASHSLEFECADALSSMMKMHSYCAHNGMLSDIHRVLRKEERRLSDLLARQSDGGESIRREAESRRLESIEKEKEELKSGLDTPGGIAGLAGLAHGASTPMVPVGTPSIPAESTAMSTGYLSHADVLKLRLGGKGRMHSNASTLSETTTVDESASALGEEKTKATAAAVTRSRAASVASQIPLGTSLEPTHMGISSSNRMKHALSWSSDSLVSTLASNIDAMRAELTSQGSDDATTAGIEASGEGKTIVWPENVGWKEYWLFMCMPTLCYQLSYPRTTT